MSDKTHELIERASASLVESLKAGQSDTLRAYLASSARFHKYSFGNQMLIAFQNPSATRVAGFNAWKSLGRFVKKGERGIAILAPMIGKVKSEGLENARDANGKDVKRLFGFRVVHVFDVAQTDGKPLPSLSEASGDVFEYLPRIMEAIAKAGISLEFFPTLNGAKGLSCGGSIRMLAGMSDAETFSTLAHEFAHELLHRGEHRSKTNRTVRECEAEAVAFIVGEACGLVQGSESADYIQIWDGNAETLMESLAQIQSASKTILDAILTGDTAASVSEQVELANVA